MKIRFNTLAALVGSWMAVSLCAGGSLNASPAQRAPEARFRLTGSLSPWVNQAQKLGPAAESRRVLITAYLGWRNTEELEQRLRDQSDPGSPHYGQFLTPEQFHQEFSPLAGDVSLVQSTLRGLGFKVEYTPASGLFVRTSGTVAQVKQAFQVSQDLYAYRGKALRAHAEEPSLPAALNGIVSYIAGLDDGRRLRHPQLAGRSQPRLQSSFPSQTPPAQQPQPPSGFPATFPCSHYWGDTRATLSGPGTFAYGNDLPWTPCGYTAQQVQQAYGVNRTGFTGRGVRVAITDLYSSPTLVADINRYSANHQLPPLTAQNFQPLLAPNVNFVPDGDPCDASGWFEEETLDVTAVHSIAPEADILYVGGACDEIGVVDQGVAIDPLYEVIDQRLADIVSNSWGYFGEADVSAGQIRSDNFEFMQAALEGISILNSSGDHGNFATNPPMGAIASGNWPSTSPYVTSVGGTSVLLKNVRGNKEEYAWANWYSNFKNPLINPSGTQVSVQGYPTSFHRSGGSSGGPSLSQPEPFYQFGVVPNVLATWTVNSIGQTIRLSPAKRVTPDISMLADPFPGLLFGETYLISSPPVDAGCSVVSATTEYCERPIGGTSLASPLFAGVMALVNQARFARNQGPAGFVNPALYRLPVGRHWFDDAPIIDVNAPPRPAGQLYAVDNALYFVSVDSNLNGSGQVIENVDTTLLSRPGYDSATGLGAPNVPFLIRALAEQR